MDGVTGWRLDIQRGIKVFLVFISLIYLEGRVMKGRRPYPLAVMLRVHIVQLCYNLSDPAMEDLMYEAESVRRFAGLRLSEPIPDESTILHFRHLLEQHSLGQGLLDEINAHLES